MPSVTLTRNELFDLVWSTPMHKLSARFALSKSALAKLCERFNIPKPPQGHWARMAWNHTPDRPLLPDAPDGVSDVIVLDGHAAGSAMSTAASQDSAPESPRVHVAKTLASPHAVTAYFEKEFKQQRLDKYGRVMVGLSFHPQLCVRLTNVERTLLLLDALFKALTQRGHIVEMKSSGLPPSPKLAVIIAERGDVGLRVEEKLTNRPHVPTAEDLENEKKWRSRIRKYDQVPSDNLVFKVEGAHWQYNGIKSWSDTKWHRMEDLLGRVVLTMEDIARFNHDEDVAMETSRRIAEDRERRALRGERLEQWRAWLAKDLERMATSWETARRVTAFLDAYEQAESGTPTTSAIAWLGAARNYARQFDPLSSVDSVAKDLDPADDVLAEFVEEQERSAEPATRGRVVRDW
jgi:hypothetical protein